MKNHFSCFENLTSSLFTSDSLTSLNQHFICSKIKTVKLQVHNQSSLGEQAKGPYNNKRLVTYNLIHIHYYFIIIISYKVKLESCQSGCTYSCT